jgi:hypothetical protein
MKTFEEILRESKEDMIEGSAICDMCGDAGRIEDDIIEMPNGQYICLFCIGSEGLPDYIDEDRYMRYQSQDEKDAQVMDDEDYQQSIWKAAGLNDDSLDDMGNIRDEEYDSDYEPEDFDSLDDLEDDDIDDEWD